MRFKDRITFITGAGIGLLTVPLGRLETPEDVDEAVAFSFFSNDADQIAGVTMNVTGGLQTHLIIRTRRNLKE